MMIGVILALLSGLALGGISSFAALSYQYGADPFSLIALRGVIAAVMMAGITLAAGHPLITGRSSLGHILTIGLALMMIGFGLMGAVAFISPGLAVAILYLYPIIVLVADSLRTRNLPSGITIAGFGIALIGIITCLGATADWTNLNPMGVGLALMAAFGMAFFLMASAASSRAGHGSGVLVWANITVMIIAGMAIATLPSIDLSLPFGMIGWFAFFAAAALYAMGVMFSILALRHITAPTVALLLNIEPLTTLMAAHLLVDEVLSPLQYSGMILAVFGIIIGSRSIKA